MKFKIGQKITRKEKYASEYYHTRPGVECKVVSVPYGINNHIDVEVIDEESIVRGNRYTVNGNFFEPIDKNILSEIKKGL